MFDDMISTAGSICGAAEVLHERGRQRDLRGRHARRAVRTGDRAAGSSRRSTSVVITDTIPLRPEQAIPKITVLSVAPLLGEAIKRIHRNESVSRLFT